MQQLLATPCQGVLKPCAPAGGSLTLRRASQVSSPSVSRTSSSTEVALSAMPWSTLVAVLRQLGAKKVCVCVCVFVFVRACVHACVRACWESTPLRHVEGVRQEAFCAACKSGRSRGASNVC